MITSIQSSNVECRADNNSQFQKGESQILPVEIVKKYLSYLSPLGCLEASTVCKKWNEILNDDIFYSEDLKGRSDLQFISSRLKFVISVRDGYEAAKRCARWGENPYIEEKDLKNKFAFKYPETVKKLCLFSAAFFPYADQAIRADFWFVEDLFWNNKFTNKQRNAMIKHVDTELLADKQFVVGMTQLNVLLHASQKIKNDIRFNALACIFKSRLYLKNDPFISMVKHANKEQQDEIIEGIVADIKKEIISEQGHLRSRM